MYIIQKIDFCSLVVVHVKNSSAIEKERSLVTTADPGWAFNPPSGKIGQDKR